MGLEEQEGLERQVEVLIGKRLGRENGLDAELRLVEVAGQVKRNCSVIRDMLADSELESLDQLLDFDEHVLRPGFLRDEQGLVH